MVICGDCEQEEKVILQGQKNDTIFAFYQVLLPLSHALLPTSLLEVDFENVMYRNLNLKVNTPKNRDFKFKHLK